jgi:predicted nucleic acid-binding Zn ribbon protein
VDIQIKRKPKPMPAPKPNIPTGWIVTCPKCHHSYTITSGQISDGSWMTCPRCGAS